MNSQHILSNDTSSYSTAVVVIISTFIPTQLALTLSFFFLWGNHLISTIRIQTGSAAFIYFHPSRILRTCIIRLRIRHLLRLTNKMLIKGLRWIGYRDLPIESFPIDRCEVHHHLRYIRELLLHHLNWQDLGSNHRRARFIRRSIRLPLLIRKVPLARDRPSSRKRHSPHYHRLVGSHQPQELDRHHHHP
jgi:hypothetical protein